MELIVTTPEQLKQIVTDCLKSHTPATSPSPPTEQPMHLYSIKELAEFLGCSTTKAQELKNKKKIRYRQFGRKVIFVASEVMEDLKRK
ncbi:MAG: DUF3853 family protein [Bacteroidales bacterium]|nr:DUF3853 family protein [Bacteroidales bacterium]